MLARHRHARAAGGQRTADSVRTSLIWFTALLPAFLAASRPFFRKSIAGAVRDFEELEGHKLEFLGS